MLLNKKKGFFFFFFIKKVLFLGFSEVGFLGKFVLVLFFSLLLLLLYSLHFYIYMHVFEDLVHVNFSSLKVLPTLFSARSSGGLVCFDIIIAISCCFICLSFTTLSYYAVCYFNLFQCS